MSKHHLSLTAAVFVNINIMLGTGVFINTVILAQHTGALGGFLYIAAGLLMLPLILCIARLTGLHKEGNFYNFGAMISPYWGFLSSWSYFVGKLASAALSIHVFVMFLKHIFPAITLCPTTLDGLLVTIFVILNTLNIKTGSKIQYGFVVMKTLPLFFAILVGLSYGKWITISAPHMIWGGIPVALPLVLFCCLGFEASCSLTRIIKDSQRNAPRAILISFITVILLSCLYQLLFYASLSDVLAQQKSYVAAFPLLTKLAVTKCSSLLDSLFSISIATSALGGAYGILYSNSWNLYALAEQSHLVFSEQLGKLNQHGIPVWCVVVEGLICISYLVLTKGAQIPLQYTATLGCIAAYSISAAGYFYTTRTSLGIVALATCFVLLMASLSGFISTNVTPLALFGLIAACGSTMFFFKRPYKPVNGS